ncbi:MAG TPA: tetratricopeptide repeat protein [Acidobacteriaceae bacterium]|nr:tetratricopeptide repeat protein [Acidobacteriaceae bacterium]
MAQKPAVETAWQLLSQGKRDQAVTLLRDLIHADPHNADARLLLGSVLMENGERSESIAQLSEAVRLLPKSAEAHNALGEAYNAFGETTAAQPEFERAVELDPRHAQAHVNLAAILLQQGDGARAVPHLDEAIRLFGRRADAAEPHYLRAKVYSAERDAAKAVSELQQAVALRPDFAEAWSDLGDARKNVSDSKGALSAFRRAVALRPQDAIAQARLGALLVDTGAAHEAVEHLDIAVRLDPKNQSALNGLQRALRQDGQLERAEAAKKKLAELLRERDEADQKLVAALEINNRGAELEKTGDVRGALEKYRSALELLPEHVGIRVNLAVALLKSGNWEEGIAQMREAQRREPGNVKIQKALEDALAQAKARGIMLPKE